jgi:four helix bundle protein
MAERIESFRDLKVYQTAFALQQEVFRVSRSFPREERYALTDQVRRSSRSVGANIAEAWQKRRYEAHFVSKLTDADGEQAETQHWLYTAYASGYVSEAVHNELLSMAKTLGRMIGAMLAKPSAFCRSFNR